MNIATTVEQAKQTVRQWKAEGLTVGLVPTMGYLHEGHESLIKRAVAECDRVMVSVFLNPIQFAPNEDLATYPRDFAADTVLIENAGADLVFHPEPSELYAPDACTFVNVEEITSELCGKTRPTHFRGVCTVVSKLMNISQADRAYFGQKDAQQLAVVRRMVRDLNMNVEVIGCPIVREEDGLAKSSRNTYLSEEERKAGLVLSQAVKRRSCSPARCARGIVLWKKASATRRRFEALCVRLSRQSRSHVSTTSRWYRGTASNPSTLPIPRSSWRRRSTSARLA